MASFVARISDMKTLLDSWADLLGDSHGPQVFATNEDVFATLDEWPRIRWFYYCDDHNGNTIRLYDTEHFSHFGGGYYLEEGGRGQEHFERVIIRGENMWGRKQADAHPPDPLQERFREESAWELFKVARSPLRPGFHPPENLLTSQRVQADREGNQAINIQAGVSCPLRLWYFEHLNQKPAFDFSPPALYPHWVVRPPTSATTIEALRRLTRRADRPTGDPGRPAGSELPRPDMPGPAVKPVPADNSGSTADNAIKPITYRQRGFNLVSVVLVPSICHERLVVFSANAKNATGWAIRDIIANRMLDDEHSVRTRASIEAEIRRNHFEYPPFYNVGDRGHAQRWELYLILRTSAHLRLQTTRCCATDPNVVQGDTWQAISPEPPWAPLVL